MDYSDDSSKPTSSLTTTNNRSPPPVPPRHLKPVIADLQYNLSAGGGGTVVAESSEAKDPEHHLRPDDNDGSIASRHMASATVVTAGTALNAARHIASSSSSSTAHVPRDVNEASIAPVPDTIIGADAVIQGTISCHKVLRLNGRLEGKLVSTGSLIVGPKGVLVGEIVAGCQCVTVEGGGRVVGNVTADKVVLVGTALIRGDIVCKSMQMGAEAVVVGQVAVHPLVPAALVVDLESSSSSNSSSTAAVEGSMSPVVGTEQHTNGNADNNGESTSSDGNNNINNDSKIDSSGSSAGLVDVAHDPSAAVTTKREPALSADSDA